MSARLYTAIVLAAQRQGVVNPIAEKHNISHKCLVKINGISMLERVVRTTLSAKNVGSLTIVIEDREIALSLPGIRSLFDEGKIEFAKSEASLSDSIVSAIEQIGEDRYPFFFTTADNCLHNSVIIDHFLDTVSADNADAAFGMTPDELVQQTYPGTGKITGQHKLWDGTWSNCNIYALCSPRSKTAAELFRKGGQLGNKKKRRAVIPMFGIYSFILYRFGWITFDGIAKRAAKALGINVSSVRMPFADAPIDADDDVSFNFIEDRLRERENKAA
ncbi:MAG: nucleotidyltransferase family protein [Kordiimonadaceae bacterium]|nr:nucleotidyltransferase family protein [Kordiimonadaceae bacterium]